MKIILYGIFGFAIGFLESLMLNKLGCYIFNLEYWIMLGLLVGAFASGVLVGIQKDE